MPIIITPDLLDFLLFPPGRSILGNIVNCSSYNSCTSIKGPSVLFGLKLELVSCFQEETFRSLISYQQAFFKDESIKFITKDSKHRQLAFSKIILPATRIYFVMKLA